MFDPLSRKLIHSIDKAHDDCVNGARFVKILNIHETYHYNEWDTVTYA